MTLRHSNSTYHRSIFLEHGLVATVTTYHKSYHTQGVAKIIHRYLPRPVSEILVYYLWLVAPFVTELAVLTDPTHSRPTSPDMWKFPLDETPWPAAKLGAVMQNHTHRYLNSPVLNTSTYRQVVIAISRTHLRSGGFKLDYGIE